MTNAHDVIIVGARCAGSPLAMLLARKGYRVLAVDRATFPSDTMSTHVLHPVTVSSLARWGLLDRVIASGCPPIHTYAFDFGPFAVAGSPGTPEFPVAYAPRRTVLDKILVDAARDAGAEIREGFSVDDIVIEDGQVVGITGRGQDGASVTERARVIVGADGRHSKVAEASGAHMYNEKPPLLAAYYSYWSGLPLDGRFEVFNRPSRGFGAAETNDGLTFVVAGWPYAEFEANKKDIEGNFFATIDLVPEFAARLRRAKREDRFMGAALHNYFRKPFGPGWALVGDAGYHKDSITAQGILDAFRDAERLSSALDQTLRGGRAYDDAMGDYQRERDEQVMPMYEMTCQIASLAPPPPDLVELLGAVHGNRTSMDRFCQMNAGTISPAEFFSPASVGAIMAAAASR